MRYKIDEKNMADVGSGPRYKLSFFTCETGLPRTYSSLIVSKDIFDSRNVGDVIEVGITLAAPEDIAEIS